MEHMFMLSNWWSKYNKWCSKKVFFPYKNKSFLYIYKNVLFPFLYFSTAMKIKETIFTSYKTFFLKFRVQFSNFWLTRKEFPKLPRLRILRKFLFNNYGCHESPRSSSFLMTPAVFDYPSIKPGRTQDFSNKNFFFSPFFWIPEKKNKTKWNLQVFWRSLLRAEFERT